MYNIQFVTKRQNKNDATQTYEKIVKIVGLINNLRNITISGNSYE